MEAINNESVASEEQKPKFTCTICQATFLRKAFLGNHMRSHSNKKSLDKVRLTDEVNSESNKRRSGREKRKRAVYEEYILDELPSEIREEPVISNRGNSHENSNITADGNQKASFNKRPVGRPRKKIEVDSVSAATITCSKESQSSNGKAAIKTRSIEHEDTDLPARKRRRALEGDFQSSRTISSGIDQNSDEVNKNGDEYVTSTNLKSRSRGRLKKDAKMNKHPDEEVSYSISVSNALNNTQNEGESSRLNCSDDVSFCNGADQDVGKLENKPRRRGRPPKKKVLVTEQCDDVEDEARDLEKSNKAVNSLELIPRRRGRRKREDHVTESLLDNVKVGIESEEKLNKLSAGKRKPGRPRRNDKSNAFIGEEINLPSRGRPRKSANREEIMDECKKLPLNEDEMMVQCSCLMEFPSTLSFRQHVLRVHYGLARIFGDNRPFGDLEKKQVLKKSLLLLKKLKCQKENCTKTFSTVGGYLYHENVCGKETEERTVSCELCGKALFEASMKSHIKAFHTEKPPPQPKPSERNDDIGGEDNKRTAAIKASQRLSKLIKEDLTNGPSVSSEDEYSAGTNEAESDNGSTSGEEDTRKREKVRHKLPVQIDELALKRKWEVEFDRNGHIKCGHEGCHQVESSVENMMKHLHLCRFRVHHVYECCSCGLRTGTKASVIDHLKVQHNEESGKNLDNLIKIYKVVIPSKDENCELRRGNSNITKFVCKNLTKHLEYTKIFVRNNYVHDGGHFADLLPNSLHWVQLNSSEQERFLPKVKFSPEFKIQFAGKSLNETEKWTKLSLFESLPTDGERLFKTCFAGGPIKACAWCPTSFLSSCRQYCAVYVHQDPDYKYLLKNTYNTPCLIQIWDLGDLELKDDCQPKLALAIADDCGPIWNLRWCPSGCYESADISRDCALPRLGLLAASCADGLVKIYSIPHPTSLNHTDDLPIYKAKPTVVLSLSLDLNHIPHVQCTALSWFEGKGHNLVTAGFSDGIIALWDLKSSSSFLVSQNEDHYRLIAPYLCFRGHGRIVTGLDIYPLHGGRFLVSCSRDKCIKFWDLKDISLPINFLRKRSVSGVRWMPHWCGAFSFSDDCFNLLNNGLVLMESNFCNDYPVNIISHSSSILDVASSYWFNAVVSSDDAGEVVIALLGEISRTRQLPNFKRFPLYNVTVETKPDNEAEESQLQSPVESHSDDMEAIPSEGDADDSYSYGDTVRQFRLIYKDVLLDVLKTIPEADIKRVASLLTMRKSFMEGFPINSVNKVAWNPNLGSHQWIATGEQCGMLRFLPVYPIDFLRLSQVRKELEMVNSIAGETHLLKHELVL